jgi:hypothetical protein
MVILEKLIVVQIFKKIPSFYGTRRFHAYNIANYVHYLIACSVMFPCYWAPSGYNLRNLTELLLSVEIVNTTPWLLVRTRAIPTERPPLVGEVSANFCG